MAIKSRNKRKIEFSMASMSDLVFLLLIFFMITSTLISPNAIKLLLPQSSSKTMAKQSLTVYISDKFQYYIDKKIIAEKDLQNAIDAEIGADAQATVVLRSDKNVPVQYIVTLIDAVNNINKANATKHKVILATKPK